ncbi:hypothetical protein S245_026015, partial [Arachis hypogaea]
MLQCKRYSCIEIVKKVLGGKVLRERHQDSNLVSEWWRLHGGSAPNLQKMAVCLLHQTSSSSGCERNWSLFEQIHSKRRNRLEHQRLSDIVYVTYNLRLQSMLHRKKRNYDPIDIQSIDTVDFWVMTDEDDPEFTNEDVEGIESLIYTDNAMPSYPN